MLGELDGGMLLGGGGAADEQGVWMPARFNSWATVIISSSEGVIRPDRPMKSGFRRRASDTIRSVCVITPRSVTA